MPFNPTDLVALPHQFLSGILKVFLRRVNCLSLNVSSESSYLLSKFTRGVVDKGFCPENTSLISTVAMECVSFLLE